MYSRYPERPIRVPEHYNGCAFPGGKTGTEEAGGAPAGQGLNSGRSVPSYPGPTTYPRPTVPPQGGNAPQGTTPSGSRTPPNGRSSPNRGTPPRGENPSYVGGAGTVQRSLPTGKSAPPSPTPECSACAPEGKKEPALLLPAAGGKAGGQRESPEKGLQGLLHGTSFPFSEGMEFDELLILGIMLLLSRNDGDPDLLPLLALLLFCG